MHSSGSFLYTVLERIRGYLDDPDFDAKYDNDFMIRHIICPTMVDVMSRINMNRDDPVVLRHEFTPSSTVEYYQLPPAVGEIWRVSRRDSDGHIIDDMKPRSEFHPEGIGWAIEGNCLRFDPKLSDNTWTVYYVPSGDIMPHYGTTGELESDLSSFTLAASPTLGSIDRRENAYAGQILRLLPDTGLVEERVIASYDTTLESSQITTRIPFENAHSNVGAALKYEIAPIRMQSLYEAIAAGSALKLGSYRKITQSHYQMILQQYRSSIKTATDNLANLQMRTGKSWMKKTVDNPNYDDIFYAGSWRA
tara:strand:- start:639 stop:1559 length:921 start_codon:yes stop_codon:yes gene_type:complete